MKHKFKVGDIVSDSNVINYLAKVTDIDSECCHITLLSDCMDIAGNFFPKGHTWTESNEFLDNYQLILSDNKVLTEEEIKLMLNAIII